jgi:hypothetical protein
MSIIFKWTIEACWVADGVQQQAVPAAQTLRANNDFGGNGGFVVVPGGNNPSGGNIDTALDTVATNAKAYFDNGVPLGIIDGWQTGTG